MPAATSILIVLCSLVGGSPSALANEASAGVEPESMQGPPSETGTGGGDAAGARLTADEIYERYLDRRTTESFQKIRILSTDPGGSTQLSRFDLRVQDARQESGRKTDEVQFRTRLDVHDPFDLRHTKYLIITKEPGPSDEFVYVPSARRVRRVNLADSSFLGTDYTFGDIAAAEADDEEHVRLPDEEIDGTPVYVVENLNRAEGPVEYRKTILYLEKEHYIPLRIRSWDDADVEVKVMVAPASKIAAFGEVWIATESTMKDLRQDTSSTLYVEEVDPEPKFKRGIFTSSRLARGK